MTLSKTDLTSAFTKATKKQAIKPAIRLNCKSRICFILFPYIGLGYPFIYVCIG